jgi:hypothetical protein
VEAKKELKERIDGFDWFAIDFPDREDSGEKFPSD